MKLTINHLTHYRYDEEVKFSTQYLRLTPQSSARQQIHEWKLTLPASAVATSDAYGNVLHVLTLDVPHRDITIHAQGVVEIADNAEEPYYGGETNTLSPLVFLRTTPLTEADGNIRAFAKHYYRPEATEESLVDLMTELRLKMPYTPGATQVQDTAAEAFSMQKGVCQDHTHVFLACCRSLNIPARYASGYVYSEDTQHVAMHAWAEAWLDDRWQGFDITNNTCQLNQHLLLAVGMDYLDACPVRGTRLGGGCEEMFSEAEVRLFEKQQQVQQQQ
ncbi:transglutaminase family protein [Brenneria goodwinii]|uniref:Protein containing transglutaminase-like domain, putative cysteine protease n=1 Tax=Brenneria goodwinii TaxID=1109412 RepID=A0A0G4JSJ5_9GAMM|nr:transglutaminase family protein [Brenneria goodwinii]MCG8156204.1 transglutaminase family protein [Brenneria goodwinii]MCG8160849.1 transglutaminase family protein [Brenneria goodwinii]MCG8167767.1 transglutaminase family protein [Brenneria goodwinii]MCG8172362.1 transglutaminase family protein [Brenneria goodwinii]MCG8177179.1 transglutaminase family protein [Brenneria goodwinii]